MSLKITGHDDRGTYGYIYFTRNKREFRAGWTTTHGVFACRETPDLTTAEGYALIHYAEKEGLLPKEPVVSQGWNEKSLTD